ncbi:hypothetical protein MLD38_023751 [Melastoma candidum]|uniref:Uncharacterized protein n=1 Tax=Melastoma candidum TaxID=119954 RepID=A0ACB9NQB7_9MYRT|nr:hypothetical protein MLD38_023751 [Melastoma candidum]
MAEKQLILVVEGTAAMGPYWKTIVSDYVEKIVRSFCGNELSGQKSSGSNCELLLVMFNSVGNYCSCVVQRSGWTRDVDYFLQWLLAVPFGGGGFNEVAIAEGLSEALMMFPVGPTGGQNQPNMEGKKHCLLVAASNPNPLPTPVFRPKAPNSENDNSEGQSECRLFDAEAVAKSFAQCSISLSVICPKQLPKLRAIYNAAKRVPRGADPPVYNSKDPHFLVLISENFMEARAALSHPGISNLTSNQSPVKVDVVPAPVTSVGGQTVPSIPSANGSVVSGSIQSRQPVSARNGPAIVKIEPMTVTSETISGPTFPPVPTIPRPTSQGVPSLAASAPPPSVSQDLITSNASVQDVKPVVSGGISQPLRPGGPANSNILNNLSHKVVNSAALTGGSSIGLPSVGQNPMAMHVSSVISSGMQTSVTASQAGFNTGQSGIAPATASNTLTGTVPGVQIPTTGSPASPVKNLSGVSSIGISQSVAGFQAAASMGQTVQSSGQLVQGMGQGAQNMGQGTQNMGQGAQNMGQPVQGMGQGAQNMGQGTQNMGQGAQNMPQGAQNMGQGAQNMGQGAQTMVQMGQNIQNIVQTMGQNVKSMTQGSFSSSQMGQSGDVMNQTMMNGLGPSINSSGTGTMIPTNGIPQQVSSLQSLGATNPGGPLSHQSSSALQTAQSKYVKVWEGNLSGQRQGQPVFITRLEGYRSASASETLAANWPATMQIVRLISQDHMNNKQYIGKADFIVFRAMNQHGFLGQLQEKKLCAVIQLPSQTLLLSISDKACRLIGMLFPGDIVVFKPQIPSQQQQHQFQQQQQQQHQFQQQQQMQMQQQHPQMHHQQLSQMQQQQIPQLQHQQQQQQQQQPQQQTLQQPLLQQQPQLSQLQQQQPQLSQLQQQQQQQQQHPQMQSQLQQQMQQQQQMVGTGMGHSYGQGPVRSQMVSQGQVSSQGMPNNMPGGGFLS